MFVSKRRQSSYEDLPERAAGGLHAYAFSLLRKYVLSGAKVLDLVSGAGAWAKRLHDASYAVTACDFRPPKQRFDFPYHQVDLNQDFSTSFGHGEFDAVCIVQVIEHLENQGTSFGRSSIYSKREELFS